MMNQAPIFINGFQRGGTNILMNLVASHPQVCMLGGETHIVFYGRDWQPAKKWLHRLLAAPLLLQTGQHTFWPYRFYSRRRLVRPLQQYVDAIFFASKVMAPRNRMIRPQQPRPWRQRQRARLLAKNVNGVVLATPIFAEMYPDATFIALVRNGLALCEGFVRRGWTAARAGRMYEAVCQQMLHDAAHLPNYHIVRFEEMIGNPVYTTQRILEQAGLDPRQVNDYRLQAKQSMDKNGRRAYTFGGVQDRETRWFAPAALQTHFRQDVNENQIAQLSASDREIFLHHAGQSMAALGYRQYETDTVTIAK